MSNPTDVVTSTSRPEAGPARSAAGAAANRSRRPWSARDKRNLRLGLTFIAPWLIGVTVFVAYPLI